jgi:hypothetical protein
LNGTALGYLEFEGHDIDGLKHAEVKRLVNRYKAQEYKPQPAQRTALTEADDLCYEGC